MSDRHYVVTATSLLQMQILMKEL